MNETYKFPNNDWSFDGSDSYGTDELFSGIPKVVVKIFPEEERDLANATYYFLKENGISSARIVETQHVTDHKNYYYVFAEKNDFLSQKETLFPNIEIRKKRNYMIILIEEISNLIKKKLWDK